MCNLESSKSVVIDRETQNAFDFLDGSDTAKRFVEMINNEGRSRTYLHQNEESLVQEMIEELDGRTWYEIDHECDDHKDLSFKHHDMTKPICFCRHITHIYTKYLDKWLEGVMKVKLS